MRRHLRRPSAPTVIASTALLVALSGTGIAATGILPINSVGTAQIRNNAVTSLKVANGSLLRADFAAGQLATGGTTGPTGATGPAGPAGSAGPAGPAGSSTGSSSLFGLKAVSGPDAQATNSSSFVQFPGGVATITVPDGQTATLVATFSAESVCYGSGALPNQAGYCSVRILVDGTEMQPSVAGDFAFDSTDQGWATNGGWQGHSMTRYLMSVGAGSHVVAVQWRGDASNAAITLRLDDWDLVVEAVKS